MEQLTQVLADTAPRREIVGSLRNITTGNGATQPYDGVRMIKGIYIAGLERNPGERKLILEFSRFGHISAVCFFPRTQRARLRVRHAGVLKPSRSC